MTISSKSILNKIKDQREKTLKYLEYKRIKRIRRNTIPPHTHCQNCNEKLEGMYCYKCGQYALDTKQHIGHYFRQFFENTYQLDGRAYQTIKYLIIRPGFLSLEFIEGKIRSYVHPMKMYMFLSAIFFTLIFFMFSHIDVYEKFNIGNYEQFIIDSFKAEDQRDTLIKKEIGSTKLSVIDNTKDTSAIKGIKSTDSTEMKRKSNIIYREAFSTLSKYTPILLLLLIPVFGWLYYLSYRKRIKFYISHIVFSFHIHSFLLILITICIVLYNYFNVPYVFLLAFIIFIIYNVMATMMFYNKTAGKAIIRTLLLLTIYFIVLICVYSMCIIYIAANIYNDIMEGLI